MKKTIQDRQTDKTDKTNRHTHNISVDVKKTQHFFDKTIKKEKKCISRAFCHAINQPVKNDNKNKRKNR